MGAPDDRELRAVYRDPGRQGEARPDKLEPELSYFPEGKRSRSSAAAYYGPMLPIMVGGHGPRRLARRLPRHQGDSARAGRA